MSNLLFSSTLPITVTGAVHNLLFTFSFTQFNSIWFAWDGQSKLMKITFLALPLLLDLLITTLISLLSATLCPPDRLSAINKVFLNVSVNAAIYAWEKFHCDLLHELLFFKFEMCLLHWMHFFGQPIWHELCIVVKHKNFGFFWLCAAVLFDMSFNSSAGHSNNSGVGEWGNKASQELNLEILLHEQFQRFYRN